MTMTAARLTGKSRNTCVMERPLEKDIGIRFPATALAKKYPPLVQFRTSQKIPPRLDTAAE